MKTQIQLRLAVLLFVAGNLLVCELAQAQSQYRGAGSQRAAVMGNWTPPVQQQQQGPSPAQIQQQQEEAARQQRLATAHAQNDQGLEAWKKGDWATAVADFQQALQNNPDSTTIKDNLATAQQKLKEEQDNKIAAKNMQQIVSTFSKTFTAAPTTDGLDFNAFSAKKPSDASGNTAGGLDFNSFSSANTVDARSVPSGLPKDVDNAVTGAFHDVAPEALGRIRKGMQAVMTKDWNVANAWFEDALNHDPGNPQLIEFVKNFHEAMESPSAPSPGVAAKNADNTTAEDRELRAYAMGSDALPHIQQADPTWRDRARGYKKMLEDAVPPKNSDMGLLNTLQPASPDGKLQLPKNSDMELLNTLPPKTAPVQNPKPAARSQSSQNPYEINPHD